MDNPVAVAIFGMFPQVFLSLYAPLGLVGARASFAKLIVPGVLLTALTSIMRATPALFGWHIPIYLVLYLGIVVLMRLTTFMAALASVALSFVFVALGDAVLALPLLNLFDLKFENVLSNWMVHVGFLWLESGFLIVAALLVKYRSFVLIPVVRSRNPSRGLGDTE